MRYTIAPCRVYASYPYGSARMWAAIVTAAAIYGAWQGYAGHAFVTLLSVLAFFLAIQLLFAAGNLGERWARHVGSHAGVLVAVVPFLAYLIYLVEQIVLRGGVPRSRQRTRSVPSARNSRCGEKTRSLAGLPHDARDFPPLKMRWLNGLWPYPGARIGYVATTLLAINVTLAVFLFVRQLDGIGYNIVWASIRRCGRHPFHAARCDRHPPRNRAAFHTIRSRSVALEIIARRCDWNFPADRVA